MNDSKSSKNTSYQYSYRTENNKSDSLNDNSLQKYYSIKNPRYFDIYKQIKEEEKNKICLHTKNKNKKEGKKLIDYLYLNNIDKYNNYLEDNYQNIDVEGTQSLDNLNKKDIPNAIKKNQLYWKQMINNTGLQYNLALNKQPKNSNLTPIPTLNNSNQMNDFEKKQFDKAMREARFIRKMEYTTGYPSSKQKEQIKQKLNKDNKKKILINKVKIIQKWYRKMKNIKKEKEKIRLKNKNKNQLIDKNDIYKYWEGLNNYDINEYNNKYKNHQNNNNNNIENENSFYKCWEEQNKKDINELNNKYNNNYQKKKNNNNYVQNGNSFYIIGDKKKYFDNKKTKYDS